MMLLYSMGLAAALLLSAPVWGWRMLRQGRYRQGLAQRLGQVPRALFAAAQGRKVVWVHAVSVGETVAAVPLIRALERRFPDMHLVLSTTTPTGQAIARERLGADRVFFYPLDFAFAVRPWLRALRPRLLLLMESELWPRMLLECEGAGVPVAVVNARVSDRSLPRYLLLRRLWKPLLAKTGLLLSQSEGDRERWLRIGAPAGRTHTVGNLKYDLPPATETPLVRLLRPYLPLHTAVLVAGSTHAGEEQMLLACRTPSLLVLAPRHPPRVEEVAKLVEAAGRQPVRLSAWRIDPRPLTATEVLLIDTVGELAGLYLLATVAFVGGSLLPNGGHNPLEPARFGVPVVVGQSMENFRDIASAMEAAGVLRVVSREELCPALAEALSAPGPSATAAEAFFQQHGGATERTVAALVPLLEHRP